MAKSKLEKAVEKAVELGITLTGEETLEEVETKIVAKENESNNGGDNSEKADKKSKKIYYWLKVKCFISDKDTAEIGLYVTDTENERLDRSSKEYVEKFVGKVPEIKLQEIAKLFRVAIFINNGEESRPYQEVLGELVKEF